MESAVAPPQAPMGLSDWITLPPSEAAWVIWRSCPWESG